VTSDGVILVGRTDGTLVPISIISTNGIYLICERILEISSSDSRKGSPPEISTSLISG